MRDFLTIFVLLLLTFFAWGISKLSRDEGHDNAWGVLFIPLIIAYILWGAIIYNTYFLQ